VSNPLLLRIKAAAFFVEEPLLAAEWYQGILATTPVRSSSAFVLFQLPEFELALHKSDAKVGLKSTAAVAYFQVTDLDEAITSFLEKHATLFREPITTSEGSRIAQVRDPFGNIFGLIEEPIVAKA
jgi:predicted enzyme related to lactoylglutathione lyase